jgi:hypothetical protein
MFFKEPSKKYFKKLVTEELMVEVERSKRVHIKKAFEKYKV